MFEVSRRRRSLTSQLDVRLDETHQRPAPVLSMRRKPTEYTRHSHDNSPSELVAYGSVCWLREVRVKAHTVIPGSHLDGRNFFNTRL